MRLDTQERQGVRSESFYSQFLESSCVFPVFRLFLSIHYLFMPVRDPEIEHEFRRRGALTAKELGDALNASQPTVSRLISRMGRQVLRLGRGRSTRYAMLREIVPHGGTSWPLYVLDSQGKPERVGVLHALQNRQWALEQDTPWKSLRGGEFPLGLYPDLPWFLDDLRPQGFLGRAFARAHGRELGFGIDPRLWNADAVLSSLLRYGQNLAGAFVIGEPMLTVVQEQRLISPQCIPVEHCKEAYPRLAAEMLAGEWPGSSAAGEQPKFTACIRTGDHAVQHVIVKFSGRGGRPEDRRWADLLAAEHLAAVLLGEKGIPASETRLLEADGRTFLEARRFDREGAYGRRGLVSLAAVDAAFFGEPHTPWTAAATRLCAGGWLSPEDAERLAVLWWFGALIGNTDMHYGNVSLILDRTRPLGLAPAYDMLPMLYRPDTEGALPVRPFTPPPPLPETMSAWSVAVELAMVYWSRVAGARNISGSFRKIAGQNGEILARYRKQFI